MNNFRHDARIENPATSIVYLRQGDVVRRCRRNNRRCRRYWNCATSAANRRPRWGLVDSSLSDRRHVGVGRVVVVLVIGSVDRSRTGDMSTHTSCRETPPARA
ncbi:hypothetical protein LSAT2_013362 [Lamellibrachia satsuma]|nr:hypothetical protein LSAT2_013362 [Lamellibrachia satsuma]